MLRYRVLLFTGLLYALVLDPRTVCAQTPTLAGTSAPTTVQSTDYKPLEEAASRPSARNNERLLTNLEALATWVARHNPEVVAARSRVLAAHSAVSASDLLLNPELGVSVGGLSVGPVSAPASRFGQPLSVGVGLSQTFEVGKRGPKRDAATHHERAAAFSYRDVLNTKIAEARDALARVAYLRARKQILVERLASASDVVALESKRLERGDVSGTDHDRLMLEAASIQREVEENDADLAEALALCDVVTATSCEHENPTLGEVSVAAPLPDVLPDPTRQGERALGAASLREESEAAKSEATLWRNHVLPDPSIGVSYVRDFYTVAGSQPHTLALSASIPLPVFDSGKYQAQSATASAEAARQEADAVAAATRGVLTGLIARKATLQRKLELLQTDLLPRARAVVESAVSGYQQGQLSMTDRLVVVRDLLALQLDEIDTVFSLYLARSQLRRAFLLDPTNR